MLYLTANETYSWAESVRADWKLSATDPPIIGLLWMKVLMGLPLARGLTSLRHRLKDLGRNVVRIRSVEGLLKYRHASGKHVRIHKFTCHDVHPPICGPQPIPQPHRNSIPDRQFAVQQFDCVALLIARQLPFSPMMLFARRFEHALDVPVQRSHDPDPRKLCRRVRCSTRSLINPFRQTDRARGPITSRPHDGKANPRRGMLADRGSADGWHEGAGGI